MDLLYPARLEDLAMDGLREGWRVRNKMIAPEDPSGLLGFIECRNPGYDVVLLSRPRERCRTDTLAQARRLFCTGGDTR